jgi:hypothetical protein
MFMQTINNSNMYHFKENTYNNECITVQRRNKLIDTIIFISNNCKKKCLKYKQKYHMIQHYKQK